MKRAIEFLVLFALCLLAGAVVGALARAEPEADPPSESVEALPETPLIPPLPQLADRALERHVEGPVMLPPPSHPPHGFFPGPMADHVLRPPGGPMADVCRNGAAMIAGLAGFAQVKLAIAPEQMPAWQRFVEEATASVKPMQAQCPPDDRRPTPPADLPALLQQRQILLTAALESVTVLKTALDKLMPVLTAEQRERLRDLVPPPPMVFHARGPMPPVMPPPPPRP